MKRGSLYFVAIALLLAAGAGVALQSSVVKWASVGEREAAVSTQNGGNEEFVLQEVAIRRRQIIVNGWRAGWLLCFAGGFALVTVGIIRPNWARGRCDARHEEAGGE